MKQPIVSKKKFVVCVDCVYVKDGKLLLLKRGVEPFKGFWHVVGGHVEEDESLKDAVKREFREETGLDVVVGGVVGGLALSAWGGPKKKVHGVLNGWILGGLFGLVLIGIGRGLPMWALGAFCGAFTVPLINSSNQAIWQAKVAPDVQGRVFSIRRLIAWFVTPLAMLIAGPLADFVLEPAIQSGGSFAQTVYPLDGDSPGAGMSFIFILGGIGGLLVALWGYATPTIRDIETIMPDYDSTVETDPKTAPSTL